MKQVKKVVAYVCETPVTGTEMVISKESQLEKIYKYAQRENIEVVAVYEDEKWSENFTTRPGVQKVMDCKEKVDAVLVDRVWCFSRKMSELKPFVEELEKNNEQLVSATCLWDCVSQQIRQRYMGSLAEKQRQAAKAKTAANVSVAA